MGLEKYHTKRKFSMTLEPEGKRENTENSDIFVVQKHAARRLHFDFRLAVDGVLRSWAIPKGLPKPGEKHLALMVEDHPWEYQDFEGIIPKGNYGAGRVIIWDKGKYLLKGEPNNSLMKQKIQKGEFSFSLFGEKVQGNFTMVKIKDEKNSWLLIGKDLKFKKNADQESSVLSGKKIEEIFEKDFDFLEFSDADKIRMPDFISPMTASLQREPFDNKDWYFEIKWDGYRIIARKQKNKIELISRNRNRFTGNFPSIAEALRNFDHDFIIDGEIVVVDENGKTSFQMLQNYLKERKGIVLFYVFDILYLDGFELIKVPFEQRRRFLEKLIRGNKFIKVSEALKEKGISLMSEVAKIGGEGIIAKKNSSLYYPGVRTENWLKIKRVLAQEAVICGFTQPKGGRKKFGALVLGLYENQKLVYIGHAGGGFDEKMLADVHEKMLPLVRKKSPFERIPKTNSPVTWIKPELVCEVKFSEWTKEGIMRQPIFQGLRIDKSAEEVKREIPQEKEKQKIKKNVLPNSGDKEIIIDGKKIMLTNLEKIYWPDDGYTKKDLIEYYSKMAKYVLPFLKDRPQSLNRFPNGIKEKNFFQKDMKNLPAWVKTLNIYAESEGKNINYMLCQNEADLIYMANLGCIEINVWNSRKNNLENPDYMVFDIDPQNLPFSEAVKVAKEAKKILDKLQLSSFCKTSGQRGLHILVPLKDKYSYVQVRQFAQLVSILINKKLPMITSLERKPHLRKNKVYLDYLQNKKGQTMASAYCLRPKPGAPVSTPLLWSELTSGLNPKKFNIKTILKRIKKTGNPWQDFFKSEKRADLDRALVLLEKMGKKLS